jgi:murein DD-endopeptidase MepM/ murein hydrolase activator NlpD
MSDSSNQDSTRQLLQTQDKLVSSEIKKNSKIIAKPFKLKQKINQYTANFFANPLDGNILISGSFCELRGNHFHAGMDMRTGGVEGWNVRASADGYVERIKVSTRGYGRVLYIRHTNGYTTVYGHLQQFRGAIANYVKELQYKQRKFEIELYPKAGELPVKKGQAIALSGNTGGSGGPHLHFEIRNPSGQSTNPLLHGLPIQDKLKPEIKRVSIYKRDKEVLYSKGNYPYMTISKWGDQIQKGKVMNLKPGKYSFGVWANEYFTDKKNVLGVNYCWLTANSQLVYSYQISKFNFSQGRFINAHIDPFLKWKDKKTYVRLFKEKFNPLPYYAQKNAGNVTLGEGDSVVMRMYLKDFVGLIDSVSWVIYGDKNANDLPLPFEGTFEEVKRVKNNTRIQFYEWDINVPKKSIYHPFDFKLKIKNAKKNMLSKTLQMHYPYTALHSYINVSYSVPEKWMSYGSKLCAFSMDGSRTYYEGGKLNGNVLIFKTRSLGEYAIGYDNKAPTIEAVKVGKSYRFRVKDNLSGVKKFACSIDDKWILAEYEPKTNTIYGTIPNWIKPGTYNFKLIVEDARNNKSKFEQKIDI